MFTFEAERHLVYEAFLNSCRYVRGFSQLFLYERWGKTTFLTSNTSPFSLFLSSKEHPDSFAFLHWFAAHTKTLKTKLYWAMSGFSMRRVLHCHEIFEKHHFEWRHPAEHSWAFSDSYARKAKRHRKVCVFKEKRKLCVLWRLAKSDLCEAKNRECALSLVEC